MTNRMIPTSMVSRIDRVISPLTPARTRIRRLTNRRKIQTRAASRAAANKEIRNANENERLAST
jgi:hypothetical protein